MSTRYLSIGVMVIMKSLLFQKEEQWLSFRAYGSQAEIQNGTGPTLNDPHGCHSGWFAGKSTVILGAGNLGGKKVGTKTEASWSIAIDPDTIRNLKEGFLIIACERYFGGLHTQVYDARVELRINDQHRDLFGLKHIPPGHTDYFHRLPIPEIPKKWPISGCQTVYAWSVSKDQLSLSGNQIVTVKIDQGIRWDIDYVVFLLKTEVLSTRLRGWVIQLIYILVASVFGVVVSRLLGR